MYSYWDEKIVLLFEEFLGGDGTITTVGQVLQRRETKYKHCRAETGDAGWVMPRQGEIKSKDATVTKVD